MFANETTVRQTVPLLAGMDQHGPDAPQSGPPPVRLLLPGAAAGALPLPQPALLSRDRPPSPPGAARVAWPRRPTLRHHPLTLRPAWRGRKEGSG